MVNMVIGFKIYPAVLIYNATRSMRLEDKPVESKPQARYATPSLSTLGLIELNKYQVRMWNEVNNSGFSASNALKTLKDWEL